MLVECQVVRPQNAIIQPLTLYGPGFDPPVGRPFTAQFGFRVEFYSHVGITSQGAGLRLSAFFVGRAADPSFNARAPYNAVWVAACFFAIGSHSRTKIQNLVSASSMHRASLDGNQPKLFQQKGRFSA